MSSAQNHANIVRVQLLVHNFAYFLSFSPASFACSGTAMLLRSVTLDDDTKDLLCEFEGSIFQSRTSHTCSKFDSIYPFEK